MPLYEYECDACSHRFERIQKFSDPPVETCPSCGGGVRKLLSSPAIQFKGSGWYITDYARKGRGEKSEAAGGEATPDKPADASTDKPSDKSSEKPAASAPTSTTPAKDK
jgi:putative FmdB family regulatory protein